MKRHHKYYQLCIILFTSFYKATVTNSIKIGLKITIKLEIISYRVMIIQIKLKTFVLINLFTVIQKRVECFIGFIVQCLYRAFLETYRMNGWITRHWHRMLNTVFSCSTLHVCKAIHTDWTLLNVNSYIIWRKGTPEILVLNFSNISSIWEKNEQMCVLECTYLVAKAWELFFAYLWNLNWLLANIHLNVVFENISLFIYLVRKILWGSFSN